MTQALILVDHGSRRAEANSVVEQLARRLRDRTPERVVTFAHMELAHPTVAEAVAEAVAAGATEIVVHPYFLAPGNHSTDDIPRLAQEAIDRHPGVTLRVTAPLGVHEKILDVVLERVHEAGG